MDVHARLIVRKRTALRRIVHVLRVPLLNCIYCKDGQRENIYRQMRRANQVAPSWCSGDANVQGDASDLFASSDTGVAFEAKRLLHAVGSVNILPRHGCLTYLAVGSDEVLVVDRHHQLAQFALDMLKGKAIAEDRVVGLLFNLALELLVATLRHLKHHLQATFVQLRPSPRCLSR